jgi:IS5 family transposase
MSMSSVAPASEVSLSSLRGRSAVANGASIDAHLELARASTDVAWQRAATRLRFRHLLEQHQLTERIFAEIPSLLEEKRLLLKSGTIVDATIIAAPPSTKNEQKARDPVDPRIGLERR